MLDYLADLGIVDRNSVVEFYPRVRDRDDVKVMRCESSGVIFLDRDVSPDYTKALPHAGTFESGKDRAEYWVDALREIVRKKHYADIGAGAGDLVRGLVEHAVFTAAVEPKPALRDVLAEIKGLNMVVSDIRDLPDKLFSMITMIHLLEHLSDPLAELQVLYGKLDTDGKLCIEVPHAWDFLFTFLNLEAFKKFTFWSEHLILHTQASLTTFLTKAGFSNVQVRGVQRYPLANHLYWLAHGLPGGHKKWETLTGAYIDAAYMSKLKELDMTDTLIATARR